MWQFGLWEKRHGARPSALPLSWLRVPLHRHADAGKPAAIKALAVPLYGMGNLSFNKTGRLLGVSDVAMLQWVRAEASSWAVSAGLSMDQQTACATGRAMIR